MRKFRKKRRPGNRTMTKVEAARVDESKCGDCIPCLVWAEMGNMPFEHIAKVNDYNHMKSGNVRISHRHGYAGCGWHHRGIIADDWTGARMRDYFGPSLMDGSRLFQDTYGSHEELKAIQDKLLGVAA